MSRKFPISQKLLDHKNSDVKITSIAHQVGYLESSHFNRHFKAEFGMTPTQYRQDEIPVGVAGDERLRRSAGSRQRIGRRAPRICVAASGD